MNLKRNIFWVLICMGFMVSCSKEPEHIQQQNENDLFYEVKINANFSADVVPTKGEVDITMPYILVYENGKLFDFKKGNFDNVVTLRLRKGTYTFFATAGIPVESIKSQIDTESKLKSYHLDLQSENDMNFTMIGSTTFSVPEKLQASIYIKRGVCKIFIKEIERNFHNEGIKDKSMTVHDIWMMNAAKTLPISGIFSDTNSPSSFYNNGTWTTALKPILYSGYIDKALINGQTTQVNKVFYTFPNTSGSKKTKMIIECILDGKTSYYPIVFDSLKPNNAYTVTNISFSKGGIPNPDGPWEPDYNISSNIVVTPWSVENNNDFSDER